MFNLILVDKDLDFVNSIESQIYNKVYPQTTHLDFNIGAVLSQASSGIGSLHPSGESIKSGAKIVLDGLGADELFGGYRRYRTAYHRGGTVDLFGEMQFGNIC